ncbi:MAG: hypothetical protein K2Q28_14245 [Hyphomicrobium sp.]|nr:hypothetical protein [Hyphomicrobium sp.]
MTTPIPELHWNNVHLDRASAYPWEALVETQYFVDFLSELERSLEHKFASYAFFVLSSQALAVDPHSLKHEHPRKVLFHISDENGVVPTQWQNDYHAIFKSYIKQDRPAQNIFSFPVGCVNGVIFETPKSVAERPFNVFYSGNLNANRLSLYTALHPRLRYRAKQAAAEEVRRTISTLPRVFDQTWADSYIRFTDGFLRGLSRAEYGRRLLDSRIVLCPMGFRSPETFRHMEALRAGAVLVSEYLPNTRLYRDSPILTIKDWRVAIDTVTNLIKDQDRLAELQLRSLQWWDEVCSPKATARYVADILRGI